MITLSGATRQHGIAIAAAAVVDAKNGLNGVSHALLQEGISALRQGMRADDYPQAVVACDSLTIGIAARIPGVNVIAIAAESASDLPEAAIETPCVIGVADLLKSITPGDIVIVDGYKGIVHIDPDPHVLTHYQQADEERHTREKIFITSEHIPARTQTGETVFVYARIALETQITEALDNGADGLLVDTRDHDQDLDSLCARALREVAGKPVIFEVSLECEQILRAAMLYSTPNQVTLISHADDLLASQVEVVMDKIALEALQFDVEPPQVNLGLETPPYSIASMDQIEQAVISGLRMISVEPRSVAEAKYAIRSISLE